jgi:glutathione S-transferase
MLTLYTFGPAFGLPDASPFVTKAEMLLKLAGLPYETRRGSLRRAPKGKLPYLDDMGRIVADSTLIRWHIEKTYHIDFDGDLNPEERGIAWAAEKLMEDNLYWAVARVRWLDEANFERGPAQFFRGVPAPMRGLAERLVRHKVRRTLWNQGLGRHSEEELVALANKGVTSIADILGDRQYLMGDKPCGADATLFAFAGSLLCPVFDTPIRTAAEGHANLVAYVERMRQQFYPDFDPDAALDGELSRR